MCGFVRIHPTPSIRGAPEGNWFRDRLRMNPNSISSMALALQLPSGSGIMGALTGLAPMLLIFVIFYGEVTAVEGATVMLRISDNVRVRIAKSAITGLEGESDKGSQSS